MKNFKFSMLYKQAPKLIVEVFIIALDMTTNCPGEWFDNRKIFFKPGSLTKIFESIFCGSIKSIYISKDKKDKGFD